MIAAIMCGGRGSRMESEEEKPMAALAGRSFVERVLAALEESSRFSRIVAAASPATPRTKTFLQSRGVEVIDTPGGGYSSDLSFLLARLAPKQHQRQVLVVPADLPLLTAKVVDEAAELLSHEKHAAASAAAASIVMEKSFVEKLGISPSVIVDENYCHSGITLFSFGAGGMAASGESEVEERYVVSNKIELAVNVNTKKEKELAGRLLVERAQNLAGDEGL